MVKIGSDVDASKTTVNLVDNDSTTGSPHIVKIKQSKTVIHLS